MNSECMSICTRFLSKTLLAKFIINDCSGAYFNYSRYTMTFLQSSCGILSVFFLYNLQLLYPRFEKSGDILVYICPSVRPYVRPSLPSFRPSPFCEKFSSKISQQPCKLEFSCLVCRLMTTCCIVGLRTSLLLLICPFICPIFFPSIL